MSNHHTACPGHVSTYHWEWLRSSCAAVGLFFILWIGPFCRAQQPAEVSSGTGRSLWWETKYPELHSLLELRQMLQQEGDQHFEVETEVQLTFAAQYWSVFFVQDGDIPAMVHCTDAVSAVLCKQPPGKWLRIHGLVYKGQPDLQLVNLEILPKTSRLQPLELSSVPAEDSLPKDRVVKMPCQLLEVLDNFSQCFLYAEANRAPIELQVQSYLTPQQYAAVHSQSTAVANGTLSPKIAHKRSSYCAIRMMEPQQLQLITNRLTDGSANGIANGVSNGITAESSPPNDLADLENEPDLQGQILFSDDISQVIVGTNSGACRVNTRFAESLTPGLQVSIWSNAAHDESSRAVQSVHMRLQQNGTLPESVALSVGAWEQTKDLPMRVSLEAIVVQQIVESGLRYYQMRSANTLFLTIVNEHSDSREMFREGDRIRLTGTPLIDPSFARNSSDRLKLFVVKPEDTQFVSAPFQLSLNHFAWSASIAAVLVLGAFGWNWLLRRQVNERTLGLKQISSHLHMSFDAITEAVLISDANGRVSTWNRQFEVMFGMSPCKEDPIDNALALVSKRLSKRDDWTTIRKASDDLLANPVTVKLDLTDPPLVVRAFVSSIVDSEKTFQGHIYTFEDITEKERLETELFQAQKMEAIGQLSGGVAHDFNNLLTVISANLSLIKFVDSTANTSEFIHSAETAVRRAAELTQQLLDFSRRSKLELQIVNLNDLVGRVGLLLRRTFDKSISLQIELCATPLYVNVDVNRIEQVVINICINARDALKGRNGKIGLRVSTVDLGDRPWARIEIEDNGCGMNREVQARIFDPFFTTKKPGEGTGLGLSMAQGVVELLGGRIACVSEPGIGTTFRLDLPLTEPSLKDDAPVGSQGCAHARPLKILLVDDEAMVRSAGKALLREIGHQPSTASGGREALELLEHESFDAVLLDLNMPDMNGKETYAELRRRWPHLPVAICTGYYVDIEAWNEDSHVEPPKVISKPYSVDALNGCLQSLVT